MRISWGERLACQNSMHTRIISSVAPPDMGWGLWCQWLDWLSDAARALRIDARQLQRGACEFISCFLCRELQTT